MSVRPRSSMQGMHVLDVDEPLLPIHSAPSPPPSSPSFASIRYVYSLRSLRVRSRTRLLLLLLAFLFLLTLLNHTRLGTWRRDAVYFLRPLWDTPPKSFTIIPHHAPPLLSSGEEDINQWCSLHGWSARAKKPIIVDAVLFSSELDMLEIRMKEYRGLVDIFVIVESDKTFAGTPKPLYFEDNKRRFEHVLASTGSRIVHRNVEDLLPDRPPGSFENEYTMRVAVGDTLSSLHLSPGAIVINSDVDEIINRQTLRLLSSCEVPNNLHLNVKNYRYGFNFPIPDSGYWRPHISVVTGDGSMGYSHSRVGDVLLEGAGWHCTFCFRTLAEMRGKMLGYSHNDRVRDVRIAEIERIRERVKDGREPFDMWPEAFTFKDIIAQSGALKSSLDFTNVPLALQHEPGRFAYLLDKGSDRPIE